MVPAPSALLSLLTLKLLDKERLSHIDDFNCDEVLGCQRLRDCGQLVRGVGVRWPEVDGQELAELGYWRLGSEWLGWRDWWLARDEAE